MQALVPVLDGLDTGKADRIRLRIGSLRKLDQLSRKMVL